MARAFLLSISRTSNWSTGSLWLSTDTGRVQKSFSHFVIFRKDKERNVYENTIRLALKKLAGSREACWSDKCFCWKSKSQVTSEVSVSSSTGPKWFFCLIVMRDDFPTALKRNVIGKVRGLKTAHQCLWPWTAPANNQSCLGCLGRVT